LTNSVVVAIVLLPSLFAFLSGVGSGNHTSQPAAAASHFFWLQKIKKINLIY